MALTQRETHGAAFRPPLSKGLCVFFFFFPSVPLFGLNFPHLITFWNLRRGKERGANPGRHGLSFDNGLLQGRLDWF